MLSKKGYYTSCGSSQDTGPIRAPFKDGECSLRRVTAPPVDPVKTLALSVPMPTMVSVSSPFSLNAAISIFVRLTALV